MSETSIPFWTYLREFPSMQPALVGAVSQVLESGSLILGEQLRVFEAQFSHFANTRHTVGVDNGTNAIALALRAAGVGPGDEVVTTATTAIPTGSAILQVGARPLFVDVDTHSPNMQLESLNEAMDERPKAIVVVHLYGIPAPIDQICTLAKSHGIPVIEDCAQSHGATRQGRTVGSFGLMAAYSFYPTKPLGGFGDGGAVTTESTDLAERLRMDRFYGSGPDYFAEWPGLNSRLDEVQAALLLERLSVFRDRQQQLRRLRERYVANLADSPLEILSADDGDVQSEYQFVVRLEGRDVVKRYLAERQVEAKIAYPVPLHQMPGFARARSIGNLPNSVAHASRVLSLPFFVGMTEAEVDRVSELVLSATRTG